MNTVLLVVLAVLVLLWLLTERQARGYRERFAREDANRYPLHLKDYQHTTSSLMLYIQAGVMTPNEVRRYEKAWNQLMAGQYPAPHKTLILPRRGSYQEISQPSYVVGKGMRYTRIG